VTLVRTIWSTDPNFTSLPPLGCGATLSRMLSRSMLHAELHTS